MMPATETEKATVAEKPTVSEKTTVPEKENVASTVEKTAEQELNVNENASYSSAAQRLHSTLFAADEVTVDGLRYAVKQDKKSGKFFGNIKRKPDTSSGVPIENARGTVYSSFTPGFATHEEALADLVAVAQNNKLEVINGREQKVPDAGNAESARSVGEETGSGKEDAHEKFGRRIKEILRKTLPDRRKKGAGKSGRVEHKEKCAAFEDRVQSEGYQPRQALQIKQTRHIINRINRFGKTDWSSLGQT